MHESSRQVQKTNFLQALASIALAFNPNFAPGSSRGRSLRHSGQCLKASPTSAQRSRIMHRTARLHMSAHHDGSEPSTISSEGIANIKSKILQIAALTDRGQRLNKLVAPTYQEKREELALLVQQLVDHARNIGAVTEEAKLSGEWELVYADVELFRSSPFFLAIEDALNSSPGPEWAASLERFLGGEGYGGDKDKRAELFFKLHQLQVLSWGVSTVGRIAQKLDFDKGVLESSFDTTLFGLTVIPLFGWGKLLPTFGGRITTEADGLKLLEDGTLCMELQRTKAVPVEGIPTMPLIWDLVKDKWFPVNGFWKLLPWNGGPFEGRAPTCKMKVEYVDENMRISRDGAGGLFVYMRPT